METLDHGSEDESFQPIERVSNNPRAVHRALIAGAGMALGVNDAATQALPTKWVRSTKVRPTEDRRMDQALAARQRPHPGNTPTPNAPSTDMTTTDIHQLPTPTRSPAPPTTPTLTQDSILHQMLRMDYPV